MFAEFLLALWGDRGLVKIVYRPAFVIKSPRLGTIDEIDPRLGRIDEVQIHVAWHGI